MERVRYDWSELEQVFATTVAATASEWVPETSSHHSLNLSFALGRLNEGRQLTEFFIGRGYSGRVLDVGSGNGGASVAFANDSRFDVTAVDIVPNRDVRRLRERTQLPIRQVVGSGHHLPFPDASFDVILCLDTIEHVPRADLLAAEILRVLKPSGVCMVTTPARMRHLFGADPHYGIRRLLLLPDPLQELVATRVLRRTGVYDVVHIFWSVDELAALFGGGSFEVLWNHDWPGPISRSARLWYRYRFWLWNRILIFKSATPTANWPPQSRNAVRLPRWLMRVLSRY